jgi:hypothetical protein
LSLFGPLGAIASRVVAMLLVILALLAPFLFALLAVAVYLNWGRIDTRLRPLGLAVAVDNRLPFAALRGPYRATLGRVFWWFDCRFGWGQPVAVPAPHPLQAFAAVPPGSVLHEGLPGQMVHPPRQPGSY